MDCQLFRCAIVTLRGYTLVRTRYASKESGQGRGPPQVARWGRRAVGKLRSQKGGEEAHGGEGFKGHSR